MLEPDIYERRFREKAKSLGHDTAGMEDAIQKYRDNGVTPALAVSKHFSKMRLLTMESEVKFDKVLRTVCEAAGTKLEDVIDSDTSEWRDIKSISCLIAVKDKDIRPHSVMRKALNLKYNSMVNHYVDRVSSRDDSVFFQETLSKTREYLTETESENE